MKASCPRVYIKWMPQSHQADVDSRLGLTVIVLLPICPADSTYFLYFLAGIAAIPFWLWLGRALGPLTHRCCGALNRYALTTTKRARRVCK